MRRSPILLAIIALHAPATGAAQRSDSAPAWMRRPAIKAIRTIVQGIDTALTTGRLNQRDTSAVCDDGAVPFDITIHRNVQGTVRRLRFEGGSGDSFHDVRYYYDARGRLRFAFAQRGAVNGTQEEERVYYSDDGDVLHRDLRRIAGPGWPWDPVDAIPDPEAWLRAPCE